MRIINSNTGQGRELLKKLERLRAADNKAVSRVVARIIRDVKRNGDTALRRYATSFDQLAPGQTLRVSRRELNAAWRATPKDLRRAIEHAAADIRKFAQWQRPQEWQRQIEPGVQVGQIVRPITSAGCYVPGGRYPLPSTLLMTVIPAQVAGVERIVVCSPNPAQTTLAAAAMLGVTEFYRIGGAQAVAAMAYGTMSLPRVDKIVGPGNAYVTAAKQLVGAGGDCAIDMAAGPTEACIVSERGPAELMAADLVAQAEHDTQTLCVFITSNAKLAAQVAKAAEWLMQGNTIAAVALRRNGTVILAPDHAEALAIADRIACEHLTVDSQSDIKSIRNAGSLFVGPWSAQPFGDYIAGPNHTLPTGGQARVRGGLSVLDFLKIITVQQVTRKGVARLCADGTRLAAAEGLKAHEKAMLARLNNL